MYKSATINIVKANESECLVFGWANVALTVDDELPFDWQNDMITPEDLEKAAYDYVLKYRTTGEMHEGEVKGHLVESIIFTKEKIKALGLQEDAVPQGWWIGFKVTDKEAFAKVKSGEYKMFSIQGKAKRIKV